MLGGSGPRNDESDDDDDQAPLDGGPGLDGDDDGEERTSPSILGAQGDKYIQHICVPATLTHLHSHLWAVSDDSCIVMYHHVSLGFILFRIHEAMCCDTWTHVSPDRYMTDTWDFFW